MPGLQKPICDHGVVRLVAGCCLLVSSCSYDKTEPRFQPWTMEPKAFHRLDEMTQPKLS
jgi:hypothetical protein